MHPWCCTVVQLHLSSSLIPDSALFVICANFSFLYARRKHHDADQSAVGELYLIYISLYLCTVIQFIQCTMLLRPYMFLYLFTVYSPYIQGPVLLAGPVFESYIKFFKNIGCLYLLESFLNFHFPCEIGFSISLSYHEIFAIFYFKTTFAIYRFRRVDLTGGGAVFPKLFFIKNFIF